MCSSKVFCIIFGQRSEHKEMAKHVITATTAVIKFYQANKMKEGGGGWLNQEIFSILPLIRPPQLGDNWQHKTTKNSSHKNKSFRVHRFEFVTVDERRLYRGLIVNDSRSPYVHTLRCLFLSHVRGNSIIAVIGYKYIVVRSTYIW